MSIDLDQIRARADKVAEWRRAFHAPQNSMDYSQRDVPALLAYARDLEARLDLVANQADAAETLCRINGLDLDLATVPVGAIRAALTATEGQA